MDTRELATKLNLTPEQAVSFDTEVACIELMHKFKSANDGQGLSRYLGHHKSERIPAQYFMDKGNLPEVCRPYLEKAIGG